MLQNPQFFTSTRSPNKIFLKFLIIIKILKYNTLYYKILKYNTLYIKKYFNHLQYILIYNSQGGVKFSTGGDSLRRKSILKW